MILNAMALMSENPVTSKKILLGDNMRGRPSPNVRWTSQTANDNAPTRTVAGEGVVQCLRFLASELEELSFSESALDVLKVACALQVYIDADRRPSPAIAALSNNALSNNALLGAADRTASAVVPGG